MTEKQDFTLTPLQLSPGSENLLESLGFLGLGKVAPSLTALSDKPSQQHARHRCQNTLPAASLVTVGGKNCYKQLPVHALEGFDHWESRRPRFWQPGAHQWRHYAPFALFVILWTIPVAQQVLWSLVGTISRELSVPPDLMATEY